MDHSFCRLTLQVSRKEYMARHPEFRTPPKLTVTKEATHSGLAYYWVRSPNGECIWEGIACCTWEARSRGFDMLSRYSYQ